MTEPTLVRCGCGGEVRFEPVENCLSDDDGLRAECSRCHVSTGVYFVTDYRGTPKEKAASAWNRAMSLDRLRDRYCIPPDMAVLDWIDQAAKAWEELAEQQTCDRCTKLAALVEAAYWEGYYDRDAECESLTDEWLQSDALRILDELMGEQ